MTEPESPRLRASDTEREHVARRIQTATAEGRLTTAEADERLTALYATRFRDELAPLTLDLPTEQPDRPAAWGRDRPGGWPRPVRVHLAVAVAISAILIIHLVAFGAPPFFALWPMTWLALSVFVHHRLRRRRAMARSGAADVAPRPAEAA
jgi:hypothetical protein